jgi:hypothetical protein
VGYIIVWVFAYLALKNFKTTNQFIVFSSILLEIKIGLKCLSSFQNEIILMLFCSWYHLMEKVIVLRVFMIGYGYLKLACSEILCLLKIFSIEIE